MYNYLKNIFLACLLGFSMEEAYSQVIPFSAGDPVRSVDVNENFNYIHNIIDPYPFSIEWEDVNLGEVVSPHVFNNFFNSIKIYNEETLFTVFTGGTKISSEALNNNLNLALSTVKSLIPLSCEDLLNKNPSLSGQDGEYLLDLDGVDGGEPPVLVYCDMSTDGGGWTNLAVNFGDDVSLLNYSAFGLSGVSTSNNFLEGTLVSQYNPNGDCAEYKTFLSINSEVLSGLGADEIKFVAKSFAGGSPACGGFIRHINLDWESLTKYNSFADSHLSACSNDSLAWRNYTNQSYLHFSYKLNSTDGNPPIAEMYTACGAGYHYVQIQSIMVR